MKEALEDQELDLDCPSCGKEYDEIDFDYQICNYCGYDNNEEIKK